MDHKIYKLLIFYGILLVILIGIVIFLAYPLVYDYFVGEEVLEKNIKEVVGNETNHEIIVPKLLNWLKGNVHYPSNETLIYIVGPQLHKIDDEYRIFYRGVPASWIIHSKLGRCGEQSNYFVEIMRKLNYSVRKIEGRPCWDHAWAEYYTPENIKIIVNPSGHRIENDPYKFANGTNCSEIWAINLDGSKENVAKEYYP